MVAIDVVGAFVLVVGPVSQFALALPNGGSLYCAGPTTTVTTIETPFQCLQQRCVQPESICQKGEPTGMAATPPETTTMTSPDHCTAVISIHGFGGCGVCPTCVSANPGGPIIVATTTYKNPEGPIITEMVNQGNTETPEMVNPGGPMIPGRQVPAYECSKMTTVSLAIPGRCGCPLLLATCPEGQTVAVQPVPTATVTEGCVVSVVAGPGCQCPFCA